MRATVLLFRWYRVLLITKWPLIAFIFLFSFSVLANTNTANGGTKTATTNATAKVTDQAIKTLTFDPLSGLALGPGFELVLGHCSACHSAKLVSQNRMTRENWLGTIRWMQKTQGLWPLGTNEAIILDYLEAYYGSVAVSRRPPIPEHLMPPLKQANKSG